MNYPKYDVEASSKLDIYEFTSAGKRGEIKKLIQYTRTVDHSIYNLAFGDKVETIGENGDIGYIINDSIKSDNGDRDVVLATVAATVYEYTAMYPDRWIFFSGSCPIRTRLYRRAISLNFEELSKNFHIFGIVKDLKIGKFAQVPFDKNGQFDGFLILKK